MTKTCSGCGLELPATPEHFHVQKNGKYGVTSKCKSCKNIQIEDWRQKNPELHKSYKVKWRTENRDKYLAIKRRDSHVRRSMYPGKKYLLEEWDFLLEQYDYTCLCCGEKGLTLTLDHVVPISKGGSNTIDNIQPLCLICNSKKGTKDIDYRVKVNELN